MNTTPIDDRLEKAIESSKYRVTLSNQKANAYLKYKALMTYSKNGGIFTIDSTLISFVHCLKSLGSVEEILIDNNGNPIEVNLESFLSDIIDRYTQATNEYLIDYKKIQSARKIAPLVGW